MVGEGWGERQNNYYELITHSIVADLGGVQNVRQTYKTEIILAYFSVVLEQLGNNFRWWIQIQIALPPYRRPRSALTLTTSSQVPDPLQFMNSCAQLRQKFSNGHVIFLHISIERNTDKTFYQTIILHQALKQKDYSKFDYCLC